MSGLDGWKRCKCRTEGGREIGAKCPHLRRRDGSWSSTHGTWYGKADVPGAPKGTRLTLRAGGFGTQDEMRDWFDDALRLLAIPEAGPDGHAERLRIMALIRESRRAKAGLPPWDDIRRRHDYGAAWEPGTAGEYLLAWIGARRDGGDLAATTLHSYERVIRRVLLPVIGEVPLAKLATRHVTAVLDAIDAESERVMACRASPDPEARKSVAGRRTASMATKKRYIAVLRSALADAASPQVRLISLNPAAGLRLGKGKKNRPPRPVLWTAEREAAWRAGLAERTEAAGEAAARRRGSDDPAVRRSASIVTAFHLWRRSAARPGKVMVWKPAHLGQFLDAVADDRLYPLWCLYSYCGLRRGEGVGLRWADTDLEGGLITQVANQIAQVGYEAVAGEPKTEASEAPVRLDEVTLEELRAHRRAQAQERLGWGPAWTDTGLVFTREDGTALHPAAVSARFERLSFEAGLPPIRLHDLRHGAATLALAAGTDIKVVSAMMRHSSVRITADIYALVLPELAAEAAAAVVSMVPRRRRRGTPRDTAGLPSVPLILAEPKSQHEKQA